MCGQWRRELSASNYRLWNRRYWASSVWKQSKYGTLQHLMIWVVKYHGLELKACSTRAKRVRIRRVLLRPRYLFSTRVKSTRFIIDRNRARSATSGALSCSVRGLMGERGVDGRSYRCLLRLHVTWVSNKQATQLSYQ